MPADSSPIGRRSCGPGVSTRESTLLRRRFCSCSQDILQLDDGHAEQSCQASIKRTCIRSPLVERISEAGRIRFLDWMVPGLCFSQR